MNVLTVGGATQDIFIHHHHKQAMMLKINGREAPFLLFPQGEKLEVDSLEYHTGGGATNSALSFKRLGFEVQSFFKLGDDCQGEFILKELHQYGINLSAVIKTKKYQSGTSFILPAPSGDNVILAFRGSNTTIEEQELPLTRIEKNTLLYITSLSGKSSTVLAPLAHHAKQQGAVIATNPGKSQLEGNVSSLVHALPYIDFLILNSKEAQILMHSLLEKNKHAEQMHQKKPRLSRDNKIPALLQHGDFDIFHYFELVNAYGPRIIVVTHGAEGVYVYYEKKIYFSPSVKAKVISTVGAGDAFASCFVGRLVAGASLIDALVQGVINSASVLGFNSAKEGLLTLEQVETEFKAIGTNNVQVFDMV